MPRTGRLLGVSLFLLATAGCATVPMGTPPPTLEGIQAIRSAPYPTLGVGNFRLDPAADSAIDRSVSARSITLKPPEGSFAQFLEDCFRKQLQAAGKYSTTLGTAIDGQLTANELSAAGTTTGQGRVGARIRVLRDGRILLEKSFEARGEWSASFFGVEAIPAAMNEYTTLYRKLVEQVLSDPEVVRAAAS